MLDDCTREKPSYEAGTCRTTWGSCLHMKSEAIMLFSGVTNELVVKLNWITIIKKLYVHTTHTHTHTHTRPKVYYRSFSKIWAFLHNTNIKKLKFIITNEKCTPLCTLPLNYLLWNNGRTWIFLSLKGLSHDTDIHCELTAFWPDLSFSL